MEQVDVNLFLALRPFVWDTKRYANRGRLLATSAGKIRGGGRKSTQRKRARLELWDSLL